MYSRSFTKVNFNLNKNLFSRELFPLLLPSFLILWYQSLNRDILVIDPKVSSPFSKFTPFSFNHSLSINIDNDNYLFWRQWVSTIVHGYKFRHFIDGLSCVLEKFLSPQDVTLSNINKAFLDYKRQDQLPVSWLISSMLKSMLTWMVGCKTSYHI